MKVLITNDDGIDRVGIRVLASVAADLGLDVVVAAPDRERSGASASLSAIEDGGRLRMRATDLTELPGVTAFAVDASPALIAFVACDGAFGSPPDLVFSGINHGPNTGHAILHSGTVGAAFTAAAHGATTLAVSVDAAEPRDWDCAAEVARVAAAWVVDKAQPGSVLNVNIPDLARADLKGLRRASLAPFGAVQARIGERDEESVAVTFDEIRAQEQDDSPPGSDAALIADGWATVTALRVPPIEAPDTDLDGLVL